MNQRRSIRLKEYDYSLPGAYFVTFCTQDRRCLFGEIGVAAGPSACPLVSLTEAGEMVSRTWFETLAQFALKDDAFVVMPNHVHGVIVLGEANGIAEDNSGQPLGVAPTSLPTIVHRFKSKTTARYVHGVRTEGWPPFKKRLWQRNYHEHIVRDFNDFERVRQYVELNPELWALDEENPAFVGVIEAKPTTDNCQL